MLLTYFDYYFSNFASSPVFVFVFLRVSCASRGHHLIVVASISCSTIFYTSSLLTSSNPDLMKDTFKG